MKKVHILLTNDDGIGAHGLRLLAEGLKECASLSIVAPMGEQSGKGTSVTCQTPLQAKADLSFEGITAWKVNGTPADCVKVALGGLLNTAPDLIVSGINHGSNAGRSCFHSGTIGSVVQGALQGYAGIAFSYTCHEASDFPHVKSYIAPIVDYVLTHPLPEGTLLNVNFPKIPIQGVKMARQGMAFWLENPRKEVRGEGEVHFHLEESDYDTVEHPESDIALLKEGFVTAVPIHVSQITDQKHLRSFKTHFDSHF